MSMPGAGVPIVAAYGMQRVVLEAQRAASELPPEVNNELRAAEPRTAAPIRGGRTGAVEGASGEPELKPAGAVGGGQPGAELPGGGGLGENGVGLPAGEPPKIEPAPRLAGAAEQLEFAVNPWTPFDGIKPEQVEKVGLR